MYRNGKTKFVTNKYTFGQQSARQKGIKLCLRSFVAVTKRYTFVVLPVCTVDRAANSEIAISLHVRVAD